MTSRWDRLEDVRKITLVDHLLTEASKIIAEELLGDWPPPVEGQVPEEARERPPLAAILEGARLARFDLAHEVEAYDEYVRNARWREHALDDGHKPVLLFVGRWLIEHLLSLAEATEGRLKRKDLLDCLGRIEKRLIPS